MQLRLKAVLAAIALCLLGAGCQHHERVFAVQLKNLPPPRAGSLRPQPGPKARLRLTKTATASALVDINHASPAAMARLGLNRKEIAEILRGRPYRTKRALLSRGLLSPEQYAQLRTRIIAHRRP